MTIKRWKTQQAVEEKVLKKCAQKSNWFSFSDWVTLMKHKHFPLMLINARYKHTWIRKFELLFAETFFPRQSISSNNYRLIIRSYLWSASILQFIFQVFIQLKTINALFSSSSCYSEFDSHFAAKFIGPTTPSWSKPLERLGYDARLDEPLSFVSAAHLVTSVFVSQTISCFGN